LFTAESAEVRDTIYFSSAFGAKSCPATITGRDEKGDLGKVARRGGYMINTAKSAYAYYGANIRDAPSDRDVRGEGKRGATPAIATGASG